MVDPDARLCAHVVALESSCSSGELDRERHCLRRARRTGWLHVERPGPLQLGRFRSSNDLLLDYGIEFGSGEVFAPANAKCELSCPRSRSGYRPVLTEVNTTHPHRALLTQRAAGLTKLRPMLPQQNVR